MTSPAVPAPATPIGRAIVGSRKSQRAIERETGIPQARLSRLSSGAIAPKAPDLFQLSKATGATIAALTGSTEIADRVEYAARASDGAGMEMMRDAVLNYMSLSEYLDDQAIS